MVEEPVEAVVARCVVFLEEFLDECGGGLLLLLCQKLTDVLLLDVDVIQVLCKTVAEQTVCGHVLDVRCVEGASFLEHYRLESVLRIIG